MATIRDLVTKWSFVIDDGQLLTTEKRFEALTTSIKYLSAGVAGAAVTIFGFVKTTADAGDAAGKTAQKIGVGVEQLQELQYAAKLADVSNEQLSTGLKILNKNIVESSTAGSEQAKMFAKLGVHVKDASGKFLSADSVLMKVADRFKVLKDGPEKTALALQVFGKAGAEMIPFLNAGSVSISELRNEARELGLVLDGDVAAQSEIFNDTLTKIGSVAIGIRNIIGAELLPVVSEVALQFFNFAKANRELITSKVRNVLAAMVQFLKSAMAVIFPLAKGFISVVSALLEMKKTLMVIASIFAAYFLGTAIVSGLILLQTAVWGTVAALSAMTFASATAFVSLYAIPLAVGAAFILLGLIIEDVIAFFQGKDSVTGIIIDKFKEAFLFLENGFNGMGENAKNAIAFILTPLRALINQFQTFLSLIDLVRGKISFLDFAKTAAGNLANTFGVGASSSLRGSLGLGSASEVAGVTPTPGIGVLAPAGARNSQSNQFNVDVTVNAGEREDAAVVGRQVGTKTAGELDSLLRDSHRNFVGAGGY